MEGWEIIYSPEQATSYNHSEMHNNVAILCNIKKFTEFTPSWSRGNLRLVVDFTLSVGQERFRVVNLGRSFSDPCQAEDAYQDLLKLDTKRSLLMGRLNLSIPQKEINGAKTKGTGVNLYGRKIVSLSSHGAFYVADGKFHHLAHEYVNPETGKIEKAERCTETLNDDSDYVDHFLLDLDSDFTNASIVADKEHTFTPAAFEAFLKKHFDARSVSEFFVRATISKFGVSGFGIGYTRDASKKLPVDPRETRPDFTDLMKILFKKLPAGSINQCSTKKDDSDSRLENVCYYFNSKAMNEFALRINILCDLLGKERYQKLCSQFYVIGDSIHTLKQDDRSKSSLEDTLDFLFQVKTKKDALAETDVLVSAETIIQRGSQAYTNQNTGITQSGHFLWRSIKNVVRQSRVSSELPGTQLLQLLTAETGDSLASERRFLAQEIMNIKPRINVEAMLLIDIATDVVKARYIASAPQASNQPT